MPIRREHSWIFPDDYRIKYYFEYGYKALPPKTASVRPLAYEAKKPPRALLKLFPVRYSSVHPVETVTLPNYRRAEKFLQ